MKLALAIFLMKLPEVEAATGIKKSHIYDKIQKNEFPAPVKLFPGGSSVAWRSDDIEFFISSRLPVNAVGKSEKASV